MHRQNLLAFFFFNRWRDHECKRKQSSVGDDAIIKSGDSWAVAACKCLQTAAHSYLVLPAATHPLVLGYNKADHSAHIMILSIYKLKNLPPKKAQCFVAFVFFLVSTVFNQ